MNRWLMVIIACVVVSAWAAQTWAEAPWQKAGPDAKAVQPGAKAPDVKAPAGAEKADKPAGVAGEDLKKEMVPALYQRLIAPIVAAMDSAEKSLALLAKENDKPEAKRDQKLMVDYKVQAIRHFQFAAEKAKHAIKETAKDDQKLAIEAQYEKPATEKAVALCLELADAATKLKDYRSAVTYYQRVLQMDPQNGAAQDGLTRIQQELKNEAEAKKNGQAAGGDPRDNQRQWDPNMRWINDPAGLNQWGQKDWTKAGQGNWAK